MLKNARGEYRDNPVMYINTQLRYHLGIDPTILSDEEWAEQYAILGNIRKEESKAKPF